MIKLSDLHTLKEQEDLKYSTIKIIEYILEAINDWPEEVNSFEGFCTHLKLFTASTIITKDSIHLALKNISPQHDAWRMESLSSVLKIFQYSEKNNLEEIFEFLK